MANIKWLLRRKRQFTVLTEVHLCVIIWSIVVKCASDAQHLIETKYKEPIKKLFKRSFLRVLIITVVSALIIVGGQKILSS